MKVPTISNRDLGREVMLPRTLPATSRRDFTLYHWARGENGQCVLRRGASPKAAKAAASDFAAGKATLGDFLDRLGVPERRA